MNFKVNQKNFWEERYLSANTPWDINQAAPAFIKYLDKNKEIKGKAGVLGCGRGHDAFYFASLKESEVNEPRFQVHGFDFSDGAVKFCNEIKEKNNIKNICFHHIDFFELTREKKWEIYFEFTVEHTSLCAIDSFCRIKYADLIKYLLKPGGKLVGLFFMRPIELGGPPFGSTEKEIRELFKGNFTEIEKLHHEICPHTFTGKEHFGVFEKTLQ